MDEDRELLDALSIAFSNISRAMNILLDRLRRQPGRVSGLPHDRNGRPTAAAVGAAGAARPADPPRARYYKGRLLAVLQTIPRPLKAKALAHWAEIPYSSYLRK